MKKIQSTTHSYTQHAQLHPASSIWSKNSDIDVLYIDRLKIAVILSGIVEMILVSHTHTERERERERERYSGIVGMILVLITRVITHIYMSKGWVHLNSISTVVH